MEIWQAIVLGLVEGITEFLPISSTGHLIIARSLLGLEGGESKHAADDFLIVIQGGAIMAVLGVYWPRAVQMLKGLMGKDASGLRLVMNLLIACIPAAMAIKLDSWIESRLFFLGPVVLATLAGGVYMILMEEARAGRFGLPRYHTRKVDITGLRPAHALFIGLMQVVALWPGTSRSMMTITGGMMVGLRAGQAAEFSFLLGLPILGGATMIKLYKNISHARRDGVPNLFEALGTLPVLVGMFVAAASAALAVRWLVGFLNRKGLKPFGWYRIALALVLIVLGARGVIGVSPDGHGKTLTGTVVVPDIGEIRPGVGSGAPARSPERSGATSGKPISR